MPSPIRAPITGPCSVQGWNSRPSRRPLRSARQPMYPGGSEWQGGGTASKHVDKYPQTAWVFVPTSNTVCFPTYNSCIVPPIKMTLPRWTVPGLSSVQTLNKQGIPGYFFSVTCNVVIVAPQLTIWPHLPLMLLFMSFTSFLLSEL